MVKKTSLALGLGLLAFSGMSPVKADDPPTEPPSEIDWETHEYDEEQYFKDIPDYVGFDDLRFSFKIIHWVLTGIERGLYNDNTLTLSDECFGDKYVTKVNEYAYLVNENPFGDFFQNLMPELSLTYQLYYMLTTECNIDKTMNDYMLFCWYRGCWPDQLLQGLEDKWLYVLRNVNDAGIVWYEGIPEGTVNEEDTAKWIELSEQTGQNAAGIFMDLTGFYPIPKD